MKCSSSKIPERQLSTQVTLVALGFFSLTLFYNAMITFCLINKENGSAGFFQLLETGNLETKSKVSRSNHHLN